jgi:hypothetical protein
MHFLVAETNHVDELVWFCATVLVFIACVRSHSFRSHYQIAV